MNIILYGTDANRMAQRVESIKKQYHVQDVRFFDAEKDDQAEILNEMDAVNIFAETKMIVINQCTFLGAKDTTKMDVDAFLKRTDPSEDCIAVYCCPAKKLDTRKKAVKAFSQQAKVIPCLALDEKSLPPLVDEYLKTYDLHLEPDAYRYFIKHVGMDPMIVENEIIKCKTYSDSLTLEDVRSLVHPANSEDIFKMVNALFDRQAIRFLEIYRSFRSQGMEPVAVVALLAGQIRFLYQVRVQMDMGYNQDEIASHLKAHPYRVKVNMQRAWDYLPQDLLDQLEQLSEFDQNMKMGKIDKDQGFEQWIFRQLF